MCFDFRRARSHPLGPTITSRIPGRFAMYTPEEGHVKVLTRRYARTHVSQNRLTSTSYRSNQWLVEDKLSEPRGTT
jgi:hypothetical protein